jgi:membrane fusion protein (multidrug efflux system)
MPEQVEGRTTKAPQRQDGNVPPRRDDSPRSDGGQRREQEPKKQEGEEMDKRKFFEKHPKAKPALIVFGALVLVGGGIWYWHHRQWESTDDAQVDGYVYSISARISGHVVNVAVNDGDHVQAGQLIAEIDPSDYQVAVDRAKAELENAQAALLSAELDVPVSTVGSRSQISTAEAGLLNAESGISAAQEQQTSAEQQLAEAQAGAHKANDDVARYKQLIAKREISEQLYDQAVSNADSQNAMVAARSAAVNAAKDQVAQARTHLDQAQAELQNARISPKQVAQTRARVKAAEAQLDAARTALRQAQLNLSYTEIVAPVEGIVGHRTVTVGQNVQPGEDMMQLVPLYDVWITANFRETQLRHMQPQQLVNVHVDTFGRDWKGHVTALGGASGAKFSLLPPENATGNYVKVVQRIPVRIDLDDGNRDGMLRPGMSVEPHVRIR